MKSHPLHNFVIIGLAIALAFSSMGQLRAASIFTSGISGLTVASDAAGGSRSMNVSVNSNYAGYAGLGETSGGTAVDAAFNNPVTAYRFWNENGTTNTVTTYVQSGSIISNITTTDTNINSFSNINLWTSTDPNGNAFDTTANFTTATIVGNITDAAGSIDITGISAGSIYFLYGNYRSASTIALTMGGSGTASDISIVNLHGNNFATNNEYFISRADFTNEDGFTTIDFTAAVGRFGGVVITAVPEPSTAGLIGLLGTLLLLRRRR